MAAVSSGILITVHVSFNAWSRIKGICVLCDIDLEYMTLIQCHVTPLDHGQQLFERLPRSNSYGSNELRPRHGFKPRHWKAGAPHLSGLWLINYRAI